MSISDLSRIKHMLLNDIEKEGEKPQDEFREGVGAGLTMALLKIDRLMESESEAQEIYYKDFS